MSRIVRLASPCLAPSPGAGAAPAPDLPLGLSLGLLLRPARS